MAPFALDADSTHAPDFTLLRDGGLALYWRPVVLLAAESELRGLGYDHVQLEAGTWEARDLHREFATALCFPGYYGHNLDALSDCLYDVAHGDYGWRTTSTGLMVSIRGFGALARREPDLALYMADIAASATRTALLFGHRLLWLLLGQRATSRSSRTPAIAPAKASAGYSVGMER